MERQDPVRTRSFKTLSEKRQMGKEKEAKKKVRFTSSLIVTLTLAVELDYSDPTLSLSPSTGREGQHPI